MHQQVRHDQPHEQKNQRQQRVSSAPSSETSQTPPNKQHCPNHRGKVQYAALTDLPPANKRVSTATGYDAGDTVGGACACHDDSACHDDGACAGHDDSAALDDEGTFADATLIYDEQENEQGDRQDDEQGDEQGEGQDDRQDDRQDDDAGFNDQDDWNAMLNEKFDIHDELWYEVRPPS